MPVVNATGFILHAELGRTPLAEEAIQAVAAVSRGYTDLEIDLASGEPCQRVGAVEGLLIRVTGAEAATVVNNHAAATLLTLAALATGREVLVSRGQLIETGDKYRLPQIIAASGAVLCRVGTTNVTQIDDYAAAIAPQTAAIMRIHTSNFAVVGHTQETPLAELVPLGRKNNVPIIDDIGDGALIELSRYGIPGEPVAADSIRAGADLVLFSGDKLLGGPPCGVIIGRHSLVQQITEHPLMRACRVDKLTLCRRHAASVSRPRAGGTLRPAALAAGHAAGKPAATPSGLRRNRGHRRCRGRIVPGKPISAAIRCPIKLWPPFVWR